MLLDFWRGQRLRATEPRLKPGGKYEMATLEIREGWDGQARDRFPVGPGGGRAQPECWRSDQGRDVAVDKGREGAAEVDATVKIRRDMIHVWPMRNEEKRSAGLWAPDALSIHTR